jgi:hypothetical protein
MQFHTLKCHKCGTEFQSSLPFNPALGHHLYCSDPCEAAAREEAAEELAKLRAFKAYVHKRLDEMGVPADPESPHKAEGCRIGGRLDEVGKLLKQGCAACGFPVNADGSCSRSQCYNND